MNFELNIIENYTNSVQKKAWSTPSFEIINKSRIKSGGKHAAFPEGTLPLSSYVS